MDAQRAIRNSLDMGEMIGMAYLGDLSDAEMMQRPHQKCHHINYQVGHLILSENGMLATVGKMPPLPDGFENAYGKGKGDSNNPADYLSKEQLLAVYKTQRQATLEILSQVSPATLDEPSGLDYAPTKADAIALNGAHWLMHCGQWVIVRRQNDKPVVI